MKGWHFLKEDRSLRWGSRETVKPGVWLRANGTLLMCENGMHASKRLIDALTYAPGPIVCRVELRGEIEHDTDKMVGRERKVIWMADATETLHRFARLCALDVVHLWDASDVVLRYLKTGDESLRATVLAAARAAAAARDAAQNAAWAAARDAAAAAAAAEALEYGAAREKQNRRLTAMIARLRPNGD